MSKRVINSFLSRKVADSAVLVERGVRFNAEQVAKRLLS